MNCQIQFYNENGTPTELGLLLSWATMEYLECINHLLKIVFISVLHYLSYPRIFLFFFLNFLGNLRMIINAEEWSYLPNFFISFVKY